MFDNVRHYRRPPWLPGPGLAAGIIVVAALFLFSHPEFFYGDPADAQAGDCIGFGGGKETSAEDARPVECEDPEARFLVLGRGDSAMDGPVIPSMAGISGLDPCTAFPNTTYVFSVGTQVGSTSDVLCLEPVSDDPADHPDGSGSAEPSNSPENPLPSPYSTPSPDYERPPAPAPGAPD